jgi:uncharacterized protein
MPSSERIQPAKTRIVTCPTCGGDSVFSAENAWRPFCSERCKQIDFGAWAAEDFRVALEKPEDDTDPGDPANPK